MSHSNVTALITWGAILMALGVLGLAHGAVDCALSDWLPPALLNQHGYSIAGSSHISAFGGGIMFVVGVWILFIAGREWVGR